MVEVTLDLDVNLLQVKHAGRPQLSPPEALIGSAQRAGNWQLALQIFNAMPRPGRNPAMCTTTVKPNTYTYSFSDANQFTNPKSHPDSYSYWTYSFAKSSTSYLCTYFRSYTIFGIIYFRQCPFYGRCINCFIKWSLL